MLDQNLLNSEDNDNNHISSTRRRNNEASKRFRDRKRAQIKANEITIKQLYQTINRLNDKVKQLTIENKYWKLQINKLNQQRLESLLSDIKSNAQSSSNL